MVSAASRFMGGSPDGSYLLVYAVGTALAWGVGAQLAPGRLGRSALSRARQLGDAVALAGGLAVLLQGPLLPLSGHAWLSPRAFLGDGAKALRMATGERVHRDRPAPVPEPSSLAAHRRPGCQDLAWLRAAVLLGAELIRSRDELRVWLWTLLIATLPASIYGIYEFKLGQSGALAAGTRPGEFGGGYVATDFESGIFRLSSLFPSSTTIRLPPLLRGVCGGVRAHPGATSRVAGRGHRTPRPHRHQHRPHRLEKALPPRTGSVGLFILVEKNRARQVKGALIAGVAGVVMALVLGTAIVLRVNSIGDVYDDRLAYAQTSFSDALRRAPLGLGTGMASGPAGHLDPDRLFIETLPAKTVFELGILGLAALVLFYGAVATRGLALRVAAMRRI